jgi:2-succinyl-5-enolpyruvyl-6-hydroxy-3-cyclohexene-1-carboxylate synthase
MSLGPRAQEFIQPDVLITVGTNIISRKIKAILRKSKPTHFHIGLHEKPMDTYNCLENFFSVSPKQVFSEMQTLRCAEIEYGSVLRKAYHLATEVGLKHIDSAPFSDLKAIRIIAQTIPNFTTIQLGNSSIIRYYHLVYQGENNRFESNRGAAGIDGCTSTAVGYAYNSPSQVYFISGELAFMYDSNAFWNKYVSQNLKVIVINNGGGGIFRIIDGAKDSNTLESLQETPHDLSVENLVRRYSLKYLSASNENELLHGLHVLHAEQECTILEVFTPRLENAEILDSFFKAIHLNHE